MSRSRISVITPPDAEHGFALAGVAHLVAASGEAEGKLRDAMQAAETELVLVDERLMRELGEDRIRELERTWKGVVLALPSPEKAAPEAEDYAARLIRRAIGYHVRLKF